MKGSTITKIILSFLFIFSTILGGQLNADPSKIYESGEIFISSTIEFLVVSLTMMVVPLACKIIYGHSIGSEKGKTICRWNILIVLVLFLATDIIKMGGIYDEVFNNLGANLVYVLIYYYINSRLFFHKKSNSEVMDNTKPETTSKSPKFSLSDPSESMNDANAYLRLTVPPDHNPPTKDEHPQIPIPTANKQEYIPVDIPKNSSQQKGARFCSCCGSQINNDTKQCTGCGKQYFKGVSWKAMCNVGIILFLAASVATNCIQYQKNAELSASIEQLESTNKTLKSTIDYLKQDNKKLKGELDDTSWAAELIDEHIVFIEDDDSGLYHKYQCLMFNSGWAHDISSAKNLGYEPCPSCCG